MRTREHLVKFLLFLKWPFMLYVHIVVGTCLTVQKFTFARLDSALRLQRAV